MANAKKTLYEILDVPPRASLPEIQAAHRRSCRKVLLGKPGLSREDIDYQLKLIDLALHTLSDQASRDTYDAQLSARNMPVTAVVPLSADATSLNIAAAIEESQKITAVIVNADESPLKIFSTAAASSVSALTKIFRIVVGVVALGAILKMSTCILIGRQPERAAGGISKAEEKVILQEYYQTHGVRPGSKVEADLLEIENRRKENALREAAREKQKEEERDRKFVEESRRSGQQASEDFRRAEERARYEEEHRKQQLERESRMKEEAEREAERVRLERARRKAGLETTEQSD